MVKKKSVRVSGLLHVDPNFLRMSMYSELSRPGGDTSRWEKVLKRLVLINQYHPIDTTKTKCNDIKLKIGDKLSKNTNKEVYNTVKDTLINQGVVFFGGFAITQYTNYMPKKKSAEVPLYLTADFDVISHNPEMTAEIVLERLMDIGITNCKINKREGVGEIIPLHYEIQVENKRIAFIYKPIACHSYNTIKIDGHLVKIATIDTMLSFYLAFLYSDRPYFKNYSDRILCMAEFLFDVQSKNRLKQNGLLKRFSINCYGHHQTVEEIRAEKSAKFKEIKDKRGSLEFEEWFLNYRPGNKDVLNKKTMKDTPRKKRQTKKNGIFLWGYNKKNNNTRKQKKKKYPF